VQLEALGVRAFEIDVHSTRSEGFAVYHLPVIDERTTCGLLRDCLQALKGWSDTHPAHEPIFVWIEPKDDVDLASPVLDLDLLEREILSVWPEERLITPGLVQRGFPSLREAIKVAGWPAVGEVQGRAMFILLDSGEHRERFLHGRRDAQALDGRVMFAMVRPGELDWPIAAVTKINDPRSEAVLSALRSGLLVGSNTGGAGQSEEENAARRRAALERGVHLLMDDYPEQINLSHPRQRSP